MQTPSDKKKIIHKSIDEEGIIEIIDEGNTRSLHFGSLAKQSSMLQSHPQALILSYTSTMMASLLFNNNPGSILIIGLGGGSIAKFLLHHFPNCQIDAIEKREKVVKLGFAYFKLPDTDRLKITIGDGTQRVRQLKDLHKQYDLIIIDAFTSDDVSPAITDISFFFCCSGLLQPNGVMSINLWNKSLNFKKTTRMIKSVFHNNILSIPANNKRNIIYFGLQHDIDRKGLQSLKPRAIQLEEQLGLPFRGYLKTFYKRSNLIGRLLP